MISIVGYLVFMRVTEVAREQKREETQRNHQPSRSI